MLTFRNTACSIFVRSYVQNDYSYLSMNMEQTEYSETSAYKIQTLGNYPEENTQLLELLAQYLLRDLATHFALQLVGLPSKQDELSPTPLSFRISSHTKGDSMWSKVLFLLLMQKIFYVLNSGTS
jgi:hypothetical protein